MQGVMEEPEVLLDLRVAGVVPVNEIRTGDLSEKKPVIAFQGKLIKSLPILHAELDAAGLRIRQDLFQGINGALKKLFLLHLPLFLQLRTELLVSGSSPVAASGH